MFEATADPNSTTSTDDAEPAEGPAPHKMQPLESRERSRLLSERLFNRLAELGISKVTIGFSGWQDYGHIKYMLTERSVANTGVALTEADFDGKPVSFVLQEFVFGQLNALHEDWKNEDGSLGTYTFDVERRKVDETFTVRETVVQDNVPQHDEERDERLKNNLFTRLAELGVASVQVECQGGGDQGEVSSAVPTMEPGRTAPILEETEFGGKPIWDAIEEVVLVELSSEFPGWELDWGSDAAYILDVPEREVICVGFVELEEEEDEETGDEEDDEDEIDSDEKE